MKQKIRQFMYGRYGLDELNYLLIAGYLVCMLLSNFISFFSGLGLVCIFYAIYRAFSKNIYQRRIENGKVVPYVAFFKAAFANRKTHKVFLCPVCKKTLRVPKGKGKITLSCPCGNTLHKKS